MDPESDGFMYTSKQEESCSNPHLRLCYWYIEMPEDDTPLHEEENRRSAELTFMWTNVLSASWSIIADTGTQKENARTMKGRIRSSTAKGTDSKGNAASKGSKDNKRGAPSSSREPSKRGRVAHTVPTKQEEPTPVVVDAVVSEAKSSKSNSQSRVSCGPVFWHGTRKTLAIMEVSGKFSFSMSASPKS